MFHHTCTAAAVLALLACDAPPRARQTASAYSSPTDTTANTLLGQQFQAPPLLPAVKDQLRRFAEQPQQRTRENLTGYKHQLATLTTAMEADIQRLGGANMEIVSALADSAADDLGGGTGKARDDGDDAIDDARLQRHIARVERLIAIYGSTVRQASRSRS
jgi:hypothetical protein